MRFFRRRRREANLAGQEGTPEEHAISEREEQKRRSALADEDYNKAMRRLAIEAHDAAGVRFYDEKLRDLQTLRYELEVLGNDSPRQGRSQGRSQGQGQGRSQREPRDD